MCVFSSLFMYIVAYARELMKHPFVCMKLFNVSRCCISVLITSMGSFFFFVIDSIDFVSEVCCITLHMYLNPITLYLFGCLIKNNDELEFRVYYKPNVKMITYISTHTTTPARKECYILTFDPAQNAIQGDAPEEGDTFQWPVIKRDRVGGLRLIIWDKVKVPLCHYRVIHRKRVTCELHDSYFRLMTIKHAISKIEWTIEWALNYYIAQTRQKSRQLEFEFQLEARCGRETHTRPKGLEALMNWGPEKLLIRCSKGSQHPAEWTPEPPVEHQENEKDTTLMAIRVGVKIYQFCSVSRSLSQ